LAAAGPENIAVMLKHSIFDVLSTEQKEALQLAAYGRIDGSYVNLN